MSGLGSIYETTRLALSEHTAELARLQQTAASGVRLRRVSDAPAEAFRLLGLRAEGKTLATYRENIGRITDSLNVASSILSQMSNIMARTRELVTQGTSGTYSAADRQPVAREIGGLLEQLVSLANTRHGGRYCFGGSSTRTAPYEAVTENGTITAVRYVGNREPVEAPVAPGVDQATVLVGDEFFRSHDRQTPEFYGETGAAPGAATSTVRNNVWMAVTHGTTTYLGASGIAAGTSSADGDTILGNAHTLTIDAPNQTLRLDDGTDVAFTPGDTDVCVTGADGDRVYVDTSALGPAFQGTVGIQATGDLSIDDGATTAAIDFADANLAVTDSETGRALYVDCTGIERTGLEPVRVPGTADLFSAMIAMRDLFLNVRELPENEQLTWLGDMAALVNEVAGNLTLASTSIGSGIGRMDSLDEGLETRQHQTEDQAAALENADIVQVATDLARRQTLYEMTLASAAKLLRLSLFDYINY
ncbi:MAG: flagellar hook-associated protein FlgL [Planctomycetota bacterium]|nr:flagellar hook-associated protein FlgL [Planctomycetota bacterium]